MKKEISWGNDKDFYGEDEIVVTITLAEYRDLVSFKAKYDAELAEKRMKILNQDKEIEQLKRALDAIRQPYSEVNDDA